jgi:acyl-CoA thioester hydrolase
MTRLLADYPYRRVLGTRWADNDIHGHVNNAHYYALFDTLINAYLIREGGHDIYDGPVIGLCAESHCHYHTALAFPDDVMGAMGVEKLGRSSVTYALALGASEEGPPAATGSFTHVFVERRSRRPTPIEGRLRRCLEQLTLG